MVVELICEGHVPPFNHFQWNANIGFEKKIAVYLENIG